MRASYVTGLALALTLALSAAAPAAARDKYPTTSAAAMALYEGDPDKWLDGPVEYLILDEERDKWKGMSTSDQRAFFSARFWELRDNDPRDRTNPYKDAFYERVAYANGRYRDSPFRGWKSDRGRIAVTIGLPDHERPAISGRGLVWTYYTFGEHAGDKSFTSSTGRVEIAFVASGTNRNNYRISGSQGTGIYPSYVLNALEYSRRVAAGTSARRPVC